MWRFNMMDLARNRRRRSQSFPSSRREFPQLQPLISQRSSSCPELYQSSISPTRDPAAYHPSIPYYGIINAIAQGRRESEQFSNLSQSSNIEEFQVQPGHTEIHGGGDGSLGAQVSSPPRSSVEAPTEPERESGNLMRTPSDTITSSLDDRKVIYRNDAMEWKCEDHKFGMIFQSESLPTGAHESIVEISVTPGEDYVLPMLTVPVSMFFSINCQHKFQKNVLVSIEHFSAETSDLSFVVSSNPQPPFHFELLRGGVFYERNGVTERTEFSILGIVMTRIRTGRWPRMLYYCALYTNNPEDYTWTVYIYITKDSATYRHRIKEDMKDSDKILNTYTVATVNHTIDYFTLDVSMNDEEKLCGWKLPPYTNPIRIQRRRIDRCRGIPTAANFKIILDVSKTRNLSAFVHSYKIADVDQENILSLTLTPRGLHARQESENSATESLSTFDLEELQHQRSKLITGLKFEMNWLASEFVYLGILSSQHQDKISSMTFPLTSDERADIIVSAIMDKLKLDCNNLRSILKVLRKRPNLYKETIALLEDKKLWKTT